MNTQLIKSILAIELAKFSEPTLQMELFASRIFTAILDKVYSESLPIQDMENKEQKAPAVEQRSKKSSVLHKFNVPFTCLICGKDQLGYSKKSKACSPLINKDCAETFSKVKAVIERAKNRFNFDKEKDYPLAVAIVKERLNCECPKDKRKHVKPCQFVNCKNSPQEYIDRHEKKNSEL